MCGCYPDMTEREAVRILMGGIDPDNTFKWWYCHDMEDLDDTLLLIQDAKEASDSAWDEGDNELSTWYYRITEFLHDEVRREVIKYIDKYL